MCVLPRQTRSIVMAGFAFVLTTFAQAVFAGEGVGPSPFGALGREGFPIVSRPVTAEHDALFAWPHDVMTDASSAAEQSNMPPDDVVFAVPALPASQEVVAAPAIMAPSAPLIEIQMAAEHEALFTWPHEAMTDAWSAAELSDEPPDDVVFALPALPAIQEVVAAPAIMAPSAPLIETQYDAVVFGPPSAVANSDPVPDRPAGPSSSPSSTTGARSVPAPPAEETTRLKARARELLADGFVASARALLEDAASGGDAESEYLLAQTYDPQALTRSGVIGVAGDAGKAEAFYRAAQIRGYPRPDDNASAAQP